MVQNRNPKKAVSRWAQFSRLSSQMAVKHTSAQTVEIAATYVEWWSCGGRAQYTPPLSAIQHCSHNI